MPVLSLRLKEASFLHFCHYFLSSFPWVACQSEEVDERQPCKSLLPEVGPSQPLQICMVAVTEILKFFVCSIIMGIPN